ncbi:uncharacterized protein BDW70DRAFT_131699 [Aspergillus foveolatus]|uniref:uncharacterized protein n=1 Tax=Aspergillus foveolatus TaxID=210207 RepID=UPI003CCD79B5
MREKLVVLLIYKTMDYVSRTGLFLFLFFLHFFFQRCCHLLIIERTHFPSLPHFMYFQEHAFESPCRSKHVSKGPSWQFKCP